jgi:dihydroxyacetone kinase
MTTRTRADDTGLGALDPATTTARDATHFRVIIAAAEAVDAAESALRAAVRAAREAGDSWTVIGAALGVSKQAAQQRFAKV